MKLSYGIFSDVTPVMMVSATATYGVGLLTYIVLGFCNLFGIECVLYNRKVDAAKRSATQYLIQKAEQVGADGIMGIQYQLHGLTVLMYGIAYRG